MSQSRSGSSSNSSPSSGSSSSSSSGSSLFPDLARAPSLSPSGGTCKEKNVVCQCGCDELLASLSAGALKLHCHLTGRVETEKMYQGTICAPPSKTGTRQNSASADIVFHQADRNEMESRLRYQMAAYRLAHLFGIRNGAAAAAARRAVRFVDPYTNQAVVMDGWIEAGTGEELPRALRLRAQRELGSSASRAVSTLIKGDRTLLDNIAEAVFFRLVLLCERDPSGRNFLHTADGLIRSINISEGSAFTADRHCRLLLHPFFGNVVLRIFEELSLKPLPAHLAQRARAFLDIYGPSQAKRQELALQLSLSAWQIDSIVCRLSEIMVENGGCFPEAVQPDELKSFPSALKEKPATGQLSALLWTRIKGAFGL